MAARTLSLLSRTVRLSVPRCIQPGPTVARYFSSTSVLLERMLFSQNHEYVNVSDDNTRAKVGITDHAQKELGDVVFVELPEAEGQELAKGDVICSVESVKAVAEVYLPISGKVKAVNEQLTDKPELVNSSPYENGWLVDVEVTKPEELDDLMNEEDYNKYLHDTD